MELVARAPTLKKALRDQKKRVSVQEKEIDKLREFNAGLAQALGSSRNTVVDLQKELSTKEMAISQGSEEMMAREQELLSMSASLHAREDELRAAKTAKEAQELRLATAESELEQVRKDFRVASDTNVSLELALADAAKEIEEARSRLANYTAAEPIRLEEFKKNFLKSGEFLQMLGSRLMTFVEHGSKGTVRQLRESGDLPDDAPVVTIDYEKIVNEIPDEDLNV